MARFSYLHLTGLTYTNKYTQTATYQICNTHKMSHGFKGIPESYSSTFVETEWNSYCQLSLVLSTCHLSTEWFWCLRNALSLFKLSLNDMYLPEGICSWTLHRCSCSMQCRIPFLWLSSDFPYRLCSNIECLRLQRKHRYTGNWLTLWSFVDRWINFKHILFATGCWH